MNINLISVFLVLVIAIPLVKGFFMIFSSEDLKEDIVSFESSVTFIISLIAALFFIKKIFLEHNYGIYKTIYEKLLTYDIFNSQYNMYAVYLAIMPLLIFIIFEVISFIFFLINSIAVFPTLKLLERGLAKRSKLTKRIISLVFSIPKSAAYLIFFTVALNIIIMFNVSKPFNKYIAKSQIYNSVCKKVVVPVANSQLAKQIPNILDNSFKIEKRQIPNGTGKEKFTGKTIVYYNGITIGQGVKSNKEIDRFTKELLAGTVNDYDKAKKIYEWIGQNIKYDNVKAKKILNNDFDEKSGAIPTFESRKGICLDYSCLYVAMSRSAHLKVRLITGEGFNGVNWVNHAWNQVYVNNEWINLDSTFYNGGYYFDTPRFLLDHRYSSIAGEW
ncbi:transglutaminase domain-containing protein [Clostridium oryzae]|uniref:Transglutaminase-like superfamily protein n=1 Tax=Clostridium oryzae TaxID=1450648 RepID=A0A1V4IG45_9CLOT|nr:transglutaminase-like domain-containing protein [Clostridium oryzae]OPJ58497.1 transglutaminase-like superfamily protein [Clostridium oryzae]